MKRKPRKHRSDRRAEMARCRWRESRVGTLITIVIGRRPKIHKKHMNRRRRQSAPVENQRGLERMAADVRAASGPGRRILAGGGADAGVLLHGFRTHDVF